MDKLNLKHFNMQKIPYHYFCRFQTALKSLSECEYGTYFTVKLHVLIKKPANEVTLEETQKGRDEF